MDENKKIPLDQAVRDVAEMALNETLVIEAAAGTGKTALLVQRILNLVLTKGTSLNKIAAITFTEKAAGELKIRLRDKIQEILRAEPANIILPHALVELESMSVGTIHGFCSELIRQRPVEANVEPNFQVAEEQTAQLLADEVWEKWIAEELNKECEPLQPFLDLEFSLESRRKEISLRTLFDELRKHADILDEIKVQKAAEMEIIGRVLDLQKRTHLKLEELLALCSDCDDLFAVELLKLREWCGWLMEEGLTLEKSALWLSDKPDITTRGGSQKNWGTKDNLQTAKDFREELNEQVAFEQSYYFTLKAEKLIEWLKGAALKYEEAKSDRQLLDFNDLLIIARDLLKQSEEARSFFKERFDYILVDEFQDTDPLQTEIVFFLCEDEKESEKDWNKINLTKGKLFIVGDPKQSIYRFRRADLDLYGKVKKLIQRNEGSELKISVNFRSAPQLIDQVNRVFESKMTGSIDGHYEPEYVKMTPYLDSPAEEKRVIILSMKDISEKSSAQQIAEWEANCIAEYLLHSKPKQIEFKDCGILYRSSTHLDKLESALRAREIPYQILGGKTFTQRVEFQALKTVLAAIDNPYDAVNVVGALRSPFFACSDEEILEHKLKGFDFNYFKSNSPIIHLQNCLELLKSLYKKKNRWNPSQVITELYEQTKALALFALKPLGEGRVANLLKVLDLARGFEKNREQSFHGFVKWLEQLDSLSLGEEEYPVIERGQNFVQIMTFHKAKGLEFPLVVLFGLGGNHERNRDKILVDREQKLFEFSLEKSGKEETAGLKTLGFKILKEQEQVRQEYENLRLLYVAMTRAEDYLVLPKFYVAEKKGFWGILENLEVSECEIPDTSRYNFNLKPEEKLILNLETEFETTEIQSGTQEYQNWKTQIQNRAESLDKTQNFAKPSAKPEDDVYQETRNLIGGGKEAMQFGLLVHRVLEKVNLPKGENLEIALTRAANEYAVTNPEIILEAKELVKRALQSEFFIQRLSRAESIYRELEFTAIIEDKLYEGKMDLVFIENENPVIVDFKTDQISEEDALQKAEEYYSQARIYARALEQILNQRIKEVFIYFLRADRAVSIKTE